MTKKFIFKTLAIVLLFSTHALAYDVDTHFYGTYSMARFAGIRHEIAVKLATGAQWMDESYISDPMSMIVLPDVGMKKRRLLHFPATRESVRGFDPNALPSWVSKVDPALRTPLTTMTETIANCEFASEMFSEGLAEGDLMKASAGLHTLEDSYAHAGTISELGHAHFWHHPDRPYVDADSINKYFDMTASVFKAMVAVRDLLPSNGIDYNLQVGSSTKNYQLTAVELAQLYKNVPLVKNTISYNVLKDRKYVAEAVRILFARAYNAGYLKHEQTPQYVAYLNRFQDGHDAYEAALDVVDAMPSSLIDFDKLNGGVKSPTLRDDIRAAGGMRVFMAGKLHPFLKGFVPQPMSATHKFEKENDTDPDGKAIWQKENEIRIENMRSMIQRLYNAHLFFFENNSKDAPGFLKELAQDSRADFKQRINKNGIEIVGYSLAEKYRFDHMIFKYLFPKLSTYLKNDAAEIDNLSRIIITNTQISFMQRAKDKLTALVSLLPGLGDGLKKMQIAHDDIFNSRISPVHYDKHYQDPIAFRHRVADGTYKARIISEENLNVLINSGVLR